MGKIFTVISSPIGPLTLGDCGGELTHLLFDGEVPKGYAEGKSELLQRTEAQLSEYFEGKRHEFDLPLKPSAGCPKGYRAVGMANHNNPISIIVPCHRVIGSGGKLTGYGGGLPVKEYLLGLERKYS